KELYGKTGNPSIDPVVFFKLLLTGYLENITSDRKLVEHCAMRMDVLYFLGFDIDEVLPWHSTISRTRQLYPIVLFETLFNKVFTLCVKSGMVSGHTQAVDSAPVKANASMESLALKQPKDSIANHLQKVEEENQEPQKKTDSPPRESYISAPDHQLRNIERHQQKLRGIPQGPLGSSHEKAQLVSNKTHYSPHDPDARISVKPGKARKLNYRCSMAVDTAEGVISHVQADFADGRDSQYLPHISNQLQNRLNDNELMMTDLLADTGYSNGSNYSFLEQKGVTGWVPVFGMFKPIVPGFTYSKENDEYTCMAGKPLPFKGFDHTADGRLLKNYWAASKDCNSCNLKSSCVPNIPCRKITRTPYDEHYQRAYSRQQSKRGKQMKKIRQSTVEPVFGSLTQYYGLNKIGVLGKAGAHKVMLLAAIAFNLKKYLKNGGKKSSHAFFIDIIQDLEQALFALIAFSTNPFQFS
ncbi:MAG: IS1182 family transposase, partial [Hymenobacter sp.]